jgi:hypothetical protein
MMGEPLPGMQAAEDVAAEVLLSAFKDIAAAERRRHATVYNYWLSIRGDRKFPPIRDLNPLEISDAGPCSLLLEMMGGEDAEIRHFGQAIRSGAAVEKVSDAPSPSLLACIANRLPIMAACKEAFAFEDEYATAEGTTRCWVTLLPFSSSGTLIDFVYGFVSLDPAPNAAEPKDAEPDPADEVAELELVDMVPEQADAAPELAEAEPEIEPAEAITEPEYVEDFEAQELEPEPAAPAAAIQAEEPPELTAEAQAPDSEPPAPGTPGFSQKIFDSLRAAGGFYGAHAKAEPDLPAPLSAEEADVPEDDFAAEENAAADEIVERPACSMEGPLQSKLTEVRAKADEAREAKRRSEMALCEGLAAAYDFALDAEEHPEEYLKLVEAQGLKIQLRSPMAPVVRLAFDGTCDDATIAQLESVLAWALKMDLPRGSLAERIEAEGGIGAVLAGTRRAA